MTQELFTALRLPLRMICEPVRRRTSQWALRTAYESRAGVTTFVPRQFAHYGDGLPVTRVAHSRYDSGAGTALNTER